jgi:hypothetical protein
MSRGLQHTLMGGALVLDDEVLQAIRRCCRRWRTQRTSGRGRASVWTLVRVVLAITKQQRGWQPRELGGDATIKVVAETPMVRDALTHDPISPSDAVGYFFGIA